ncbi:uncharacterized protein LOC131047346 [Cryptomeria japonica]|uniref:uncharacterized protein LOC131047346 n=1 Tax=Cryptomeria japonica TaxID=3369 RepID=UPI0027D9E06E|nr:uncharacterized protein LOC131047346 [Cryptomeria japonica]XP_057837199.2 uncharacterized protein LOC131047346 [Cryptomeria japonica]XP_057837200.2 uncharacterized protein LOC131047346 [Cryptomeria japonica]XP_059069167.1 uncharacterized protein LOC131047346 [Cryptomeria japonica]
MAEQQQQDDDARARGLSKLDAIVLESFISPSQEEQLRQLPEWALFESQTESPSKLMPISQQTTPTSSRLSAQDKFTVGCHPTMIYTPTDTENPDEKEDEEQPPANANDDDDDSYEAKFESDRDCSLNTQSQNFVHLAKSFPLGGLILNDHSPSPVRLDLALPESSSVSSKRGIPNLNSKKKINPKPASCRRIMDEEEENSQMKTTHNAKILPDIVEDSPVDLPKPATQLGVIARIARFDNCPTLNFSPIDTQLTPNLNTQCLKGYTQTDSEMHFSHNSGEEQEEATECEEISACRVLPTYFTADSVQKNTPTDLEKDTQMGQDRDGQYVLKRRRKEPKLFPKNLMDVIMHFSGEPPVGSEDVDIVETAIKAGYTFPPPLSRHRYQA